MAVGRRDGRRQEPTVNCPKCTRAFLIGPDFVMDVVATGRIEPSGRAEVRCGICGHTVVVKGPGSAEESTGRCTLSADRQIAPWRLGTHFPALVIGLTTGARAAATLACLLRPHRHARRPPRHPTRVLEADDDPVVGRVEGHGAMALNEHREGWRGVGIDRCGHAGTRGR